jgi:hypothetical protein
MAQCSFGIKSGYKGPCQGVESQSIVEAAQTADSKDSCNCSLKTAPVCAKTAACQAPGAWVG